MIRYIWNQLQFVHGRAHLHDEQHQRRRLDHGLDLNHIPCASASNSSAGCCHGAEHANAQDSKSASSTFVESAQGVDGSLQRRQGLRQVGLGVLGQRLRLRCGLGDSGLLAS